MKRQLLPSSKLCATVLSMLLAFYPILAQTQAPELKVSIFRDLVRFAAPSEVQEMRVEVFDSTVRRSTIATLWLVQLRTGRCKTRTVKQLTADCTLTPLL